MENEEWGTENMAYKTSEKGIENGKRRMGRKPPYPSFCMLHSPFPIPHSAPTHRGFTLLELLIYIAVLAGLMVGVSGVFISISKGRGQTEARNEVNASIRFATEKIRQDVKNASSVTTPILGTASSTLQVTAGGLVVIYDTLSGQLRRQEGNGVSTTTALVTGTNVLVDAPTFTRLENYNATLLATTTAIQVAMTFHYNASSTDWYYVDTLRTSITLR